MSMKDHIKNSAKGALYSLKHLKKIKPFIPQDDLKTIVQSSDYTQPHNIPIIPTHTWETTEEAIPQASLYAFVFQPLLSAFGFTNKPTSNKYKLLLCVVHLLIQRSSQKQTRDQNKKTRHKKPNQVCGQEKAGTKKEEPWQR